nr:hypothetical protein [Candidatus Gracilibacteria bacterium]
RSAEAGDYPSVYDYAKAVWNISITGADLPWKHIDFGVTRYEIEKSQEILTDKTDNIKKTKENCDNLDRELKKAYDTASYQEADIKELEIGGNLANARTRTHNDKLLPLVLEIKLALPKFSISPNSTAEAIKNNLTEKNLPSPYNSICDNLVENEFKKTPPNLTDLQSKIQTQLRLIRRSQVEKSFENYWVRISDGNETKIIPHFFKESEVNDPKIAELITKLSNKEKVDLNNDNLALILGHLKNQFDIDIQDFIETQGEVWGSTNDTEAQKEAILKYLFQDQDLGKIQWPILAHHKFILEAKYIGGIRKGFDNLKEVRENVSHIQKIGNILAISNKGRPLSAAEISAQLRELKTLLDSQEGRQQLAEYEAKQGKLGKFLNKLRNNPYFLSLTKDNNCLNPEEVKTIYEGLNDVLPLLEEATPVEHQSEQFKNIIIKLKTQRDILAGLINGDEGHPSLLSRRQAELNNLNRFQAKIDFTQEL